MSNIGRRNKGNMRQKKQRIKRIIRRVVEYCEIIKISIILKNHRGRITLRDNNSVLQCLDEYIRQTLIPKCKLQGGM